MLGFLCCCSMAVLTPTLLLSGRYCTLSVCSTFCLNTLLGFVFFLCHMGKIYSRKDVLGPEHIFVCFSRGGFDFKNEFGGNVLCWFVSTCSQELRSVWSVDTWVQCTLYHLQAGPAAEVLLTALVVGSDPRAKQFSACFQWSPQNRCLLQAQCDSGSQEGAMLLIWKIKASS